MSNQHLVLSQTQKLQEAEEIIEKGKETFIQVGNALLRIKNEKLWEAAGYQSFKEYCEKRWGFSQSYGYYLISNSKTAKSLGLNLTQSHLSEIGKFPEEIQQKIAKTIENDEEITAKQIKELGNWLLLAKNFPEFSKILEKCKTYNVPTNLLESTLIELKKLPPYYVTSVLYYGISEGKIVPGESLKTLRYFENGTEDEKTEVQDILRSGVLQIILQFENQNYIPLYDLRPQDIRTYFQILERQKINKSRTEALEKQLKAANDQINKIIVKFNDLADLSIREQTPFIYLIINEKEGINEDVAIEKLERAGYTPYLIVAYKGEPVINFSNNPKKTFPISFLENIELIPEPVMNFIRNFGVKKLR